MKRIYFTSALLIIVWACTWAAETGDLNFEYLSVKDGLSQGTLYHRVHDCPTLCRAQQP